MNVDQEGAGRRQTEYERGFERGHVAGIGHAIHLLMHSGCPPEHHELLHEAIDAWERVHGDPKREPRSQRFKAMPDAASGPSEQDLRAYRRGLAEVRREQTADDASQGPSQERTFSVSVDRAGDVVAPGPEQLHGTPNHASKATP